MEYSPLVQILILLAAVLGGLLVVIVTVSVCSFVTSRLRAAKRYVSLYNRYCTGGCDTGAAFCLFNAIHCMGHNIKVLAACFCVCLTFFLSVCVRARVSGPNISKKIEDRG